MNMLKEKDKQLYELIDGFRPYLIKFDQMVKARQPEIRTYKDKFTQVLLKTILNTSRDIHRLTSAYHQQFVHGRLESISSVEILARQLMEIYCVYFYLFVEVVGDAEKAIRWDVYQLYGKKQALKMANAWVAAEADDNVSIKEIEGWIRQNPLFKTFGPEMKKRCLRPPSSTFKPLNKISESFGISTRLFDLYYSQFSSAIHSNHIFLMSHDDPRLGPLNNRLQKAFLWSTHFTNLAMANLMSSSALLLHLWDPVEKVVFEKYLEATKLILSKS
jgi:hypothetical protein